MNHQAKLSERIVQDVVERLAAGHELPFRLNVLGMAQHYGISRTPVRQAINELQRLGKLAKLPNGRLLSVRSSVQAPVSVPVSSSPVSVPVGFSPVSVPVSSSPVSVPVGFSIKEAIGHRQPANPCGDNPCGDSQLSINPIRDNPIEDSQLAGSQLAGSQLAGVGQCLDNNGVDNCPQIDATPGGDDLGCLQFDTLDNPSMTVPDASLPAASPFDNPSIPVSAGPLSVTTPAFTTPAFTTPGFLTTPGSLPTPASHVGDSRLSVPTSASVPVSASGLTSNWSQLDWREGMRRGLAEEIVRLSLRGQTTFLREQIWSDRLRIGRGVLRQMLSELAGQGFVEHVARRGWQVRPFDSEAMLQYLEIREVLELHALELAKARLAPERLRAMLAGNPSKVGESKPVDRLESRGSLREPSLDRGAIHDIDRSAAREVSVPTAVPETLNNEIHGYLIALSNNRYIADFFARHSTYYSQLFEIATVETGWRDAMAQQHREILSALLDQDWPRAKHALAHHIRAQRPVVQELLRQVLERPQ